MAFHTTGIPLRGRPNRAAGGWRGAQSAGHAAAAGRVQTGGVDGAVLIFDGDCGFCSSSIRFIQRRIPTRAAMVPWQRAPLASYGVTREQARGLDMDEVRKSVEANS